MTDIQTLRDLAAQVKARMRAIPGTIDVHDDWGDPVFQMTLNIDSDRAAMSGLTNQDIATTVGTGLSGLSISQLRERDKLIGIALRPAPSERSQLDDLYSLNVVNSATGVRVPLEPDRVVPAPDHHAQDPQARPRAVHDRPLRHRQRRAAERSRQAASASAARTPSPSTDAGGNLIAFPPGYHWEFGGEKFEQDKGFNSLAIALVVSFVAIYLALVVQFNSATQPLLVYAAVPFGVVGGLIGLVDHGLVLRVYGVPWRGVAGGSDHLTCDRALRLHRRDAPRRRAAPQSRRRCGPGAIAPVLVTVLATVGGLIPLALEGGPLWEPMCYVQIAGMLVATLVTLVIVPVLYVIFVEDLHLVRWDKESAMQKAKSHPEVVKV